MRKHGWQLPYHPLQVVAIAVFLALGFAFYVFFAPFVGKKEFQYLALGIYTPLIISVLFLYIWCAATDPGDPEVLKSNKYLGIAKVEKKDQSKACGREIELPPSINEAHIETVEDNSAMGSGRKATEGSPHVHESKKDPCRLNPFLMILFSWCPLFSQCNQNGQSSEQQDSEDGMFYCSLCKVEVSKCSKHCRVCDKCVDGFDHHCRWLNNCIGRRNYGRFFILMVSALILLVLQWSTGIAVLILCFLERNQFSVNIVSKLGSSFSLVPFVVVVASCTFLAMLSTLPLAQLFFFHVLLIKKGISTYDYIIALREQDQQGNSVQQSPQMSPFDVVPQETTMPTHFAGKKVVAESRRKNATVKISPWTLARLNAEEVSKAAAEARKRSRILKPIVRQDLPPGQETDSSFGSDSGRFLPKLEIWNQSNNRGRSNTDLPIDCFTKLSSKTTKNSKSSKLAPLQLEARSAFTTSKAMSASGIATFSPDSSLGSPDIHPFGVSSSAAEETHGFKCLLPSSGTPVYGGILLSRSTSDGYDASGGEDSDQIPSGIIPRSVNWSNLLINSDRASMENERKVSSSSESLQVRR
ncbi:probable protein S-acyltransferase 22 isoform X2 [Dendrobium catenatum]|uniref:probable protein S-acyltransferase 22 isoform X2 n=1 Tax=Dendrobium catenatum TaxID=906689 RepID=UPI0009F4A96E|nr:probable protein S-acyltransferase 22 isoform X2 [Dendrobium catenatum]